MATGIVPRDKRPDAVTEFSVFHTRTCLFSYNDVITVNHVYPRVFGAGEILKLADALPPGNPIIEGSLCSRADSAGESYVRFLRNIALREHAVCSI